MKHTLWKKLVLAFLAAGILSSCGGISSWPKEQFTPERWSQSKQTARYVYVRDLIDRKLLLNKTRQEVIARLGEPSPAAEGERLVSYLVRSDESGVYVLDIQFSSGESSVAEMAAVRPA